MRRELNAIVAIFRPADGRAECADTYVICTQHGAMSAPRKNDAKVTLAEAIDFSEGEGMKCDLCGAVIVEAGTVVTDEIVEASEKAR